jgi:high-affinity nickel-transport protein
MASLANTAPPDTQRLDEAKRWSLQPLLRQAERSHSRMPGIRKIPLRAILIIALIAILNIIVWIAAAIVLVCGFSFVIVKTWGQPSNNMTAF